MSLYNCHFEVIIQVEDPDGIHLNERMTDIMDELNKAIRQKHLIGLAFPERFELAPKWVQDNESK